MKVEVLKINSKKVVLVENEWCEVFKESPLNYFVIYNGERRLLNKKTGELVSNQHEDAHKRMWVTPKCKTAHGIDWTTER